jgi:hypothetical protein
MMETLKWLQWSNFEFCHCFSNFHKNCFDLREFSVIPLTNCPSPAGPVIVTKTTLTIMHTQWFSKVFSNSRRQTPPQNAPAAAMASGGAL